MNHPLMALALVAVAVVVLGGLFADAEREIQDPRTWEPDDWLLERAGDLKADQLPDLDDPQVDLRDVTLPQDMPIELPEGTVIDGNIIELVEDMELTLPEGATIHDFSMDFDRWQGMDLPRGTTVQDGKLVFPPGSILRFDDGTVLPMPEGGTLDMPGYTDAELRRMVDDGHAEVPPGSRLEAPVVESPGDWPLTLPAGSRFVLPFLPGLPQGPLDEDTKTRLPAGTRADHTDGGDGTGGSGEGTTGSGGTGPTPAYSSEAVTDTEITGWSDTVRKDEPFDVEGHVHRADGDGLADARVQVYVNETKDTPGRHVGGTVTRSDGTWTARVRFPEDLPPADYQLVARHDGTVVDDVYHLPSWSDPPFTVRDSAELAAEVPARTGADTETRLQARLMDSYGVPIPDATVRMRLEGPGSVARSATTGPDGRATFTHTFPTTGAHTVHFHFDGDANLDPTDTRADIVVTDLGFSPATAPPWVAYIGGTLTLEGTLTDEGEPDPFGRASVRFLDHGARLDAGASGTVRTTMSIDPDTEPGRHIVRITRGQGLATTTLEIPVDIKAKVRFEPADDFYGWFLKDTVPTMTWRVTDATTAVPLEGVRLTATNGQDGRTVDGTTDDDGLVTIAMPVTQDRPGTVKFATVADDRVEDTGMSLIVDTAPVTVSATTEDTAVRGVRSPIGLELTVRDHTGAELPGAADTTRRHRAGPTVEHVDGFGPLRLTLGATVVETDWRNATPVFDVTLPRATGPGTYTALLETPFGDEAVHVQVAVQQQAILTVEDLPRTHDDGPLTFTARLRADDGAPLARHPVTASYGSTNAAGSLRSETDDQGIATFTVPAKAFGADVDLRLESPGTSTVAPATMSRTIEHPLGLIVPILLVLAIFLVAAGAVAWRRAKRGQGLFKNPLRVLDPRPPVQVLVDIDGRPEGLPLAVTPHEEVQTRIRLVGAVRPEDKDENKDDTPAADAQGPRAHRRDTPRPVAGRIALAGEVTLRHAGKKRIVTVPTGGAVVTLPGVTPGDHTITIEAAAGRDHRPTTHDVTLHAARWPDHFARDYAALLDSARTTLPGIPEGCTPRLLEHALLPVPSLPAQTVTKVVDAYEAARFARRESHADDWVRFALATGRLRQAIGRLDEDTGRRAPAAQKVANAPSDDPRGRRRGVPRPVGGDL